MITLEGDALILRFPEVHDDATCAIGFQRTLRIPDDGKNYPLPPGLGQFPLRHLDDYARQIPGGWLARGGLIMPMFQAEAMWISFGRGWGGYPFALKFGTGKINAVTGEAWTNHLNDDPQDYVVTPEQPWLDGYSVEKGVIRQFVAMPLGDGYSVEEQITGTAEHGGLQIVAYPMKADRYEALGRPRGDGIKEFYSEGFDMGLAPGGRMKQEIYADPYGLDAWDQRHCSRCFVTILNLAKWMAVTGERPPTEPPTAKDYTEAGLPWFDYYGGDAEVVEGARSLNGLSSVNKIAKQKGKAPLPENENIAVEKIIALRKDGVSKVREACI